MSGFDLRELDLQPDIFAIVMATGIVAVAADTRPYPYISDVLVALACAAFVLLAVGLLVRILARPDDAIAEIRDPDVALRLFTFVAACSVLGVWFNDHPEVVWALGIASFAAWLLLTPLAVRDVATRRRSELRDHAHGAWLLASVGTSGLAITASDLGVHAGAGALIIGATVLWLLALVMYVSVTWLIAWRALAMPFGPDTVTPDSWILMGALAIATLSGDHILRASKSVGAPDVLAWAQPLTLALWVTASLWIPVLLYAEVWRVDNRLGSLQFASVWWSAVFPLGMYSAATADTAEQLDLPSLVTIALVLFWIALTVWLMVVIGFIHRAALRLRYWI